MNKPYAEEDTEREALLSPARPGVSEDVEANISPAKTPTFYTRPRFGLLHLSLAFLAGTLACFIAQFAICGPNCFSQNAKDISIAKVDSDVNIAPPYVGSTERHNFPPPSPTNAFPSMFPTGVGYAGATPTGAEAALVATAPSYPIHTGAAQLVVPASLGNTGKGKGNIDLFRKWGNLSPWYSVDRTAFGLDSGPETPETCRITGLHFLHRHGARYPTRFGTYFHCVRFAWMMRTYQPHTVGLPKLRDGCALPPLIGLRLATSSSSMIGAFCYQFRLGRWLTFTKDIQAGRRRSSHFFISPVYLVLTVS